MSCCVTNRRAQVKAISRSLCAQAAFSLWYTFKALPWHVVPFLFGMFIMVEALNQGGWVDYFGRVRRSPSSLCLLPPIHDLYALRM